MAVLLRTSDLGALLAKVMQASCGLAFRPAGLSSKPPAPWRSAALTITGGGSRTVAIAGDESACLAVAAGLLQRTPAEIDVRMIEDSLRELLNMVAGHIKRAMAIDVALGLPEIMDVEQVEARMQKGAQKAAVMSERMTVTIWLSGET